MSKLVSVVIPTYKRSDMLIRTIESVLNQSYNNIEVIVVDDNNNDNYRKETEEKMIKYKHNPKIRYIKHKRNLGGCAARNTGLRESKGEFICFLDDDDIIYKEKIEKQVEFLENNQNFDIVYCSRKVNNMIHSPKIEGNISYYLLSGDSIVITIMLLFKKNKIGNVKWNPNLKRNQEAGFLLDLMNKNDSKIGKLDLVLCESDMSDRKNSLNSERNEIEMINYLKEYNYVVEKLESNDKNVKAKIYSHRFWGIGLYHIKAHKIKAGLKAFGKGFMYAPCAFTIHAIKYAIMKLLKIKKDYKRVIE